MNKKNIRFCFREPDFPQSAYLGVTFVKDDELRFVHTMMNLYPNLKELQHGIKELKKELADKEKDPMDIYGVIVVKINFNKKFPLKKEHWIETKDSPVKPDFRIREYIKMLDDVHQFYNIIVLPNNYDLKKKKWEFINWIPVLITTDDKKFNELIRISDQSVDESAKNMALYSIEFVRGFDLDTGKFVKSQKEIDLEGANC